MMAGRAPSGAQGAIQGQLTPWGLAELGAAVFAVDPASLGGIWLRAPAGPVRSAWLDRLREFLGAHTPLRSMPCAVAEARLLGGLDLPATLAAGRPIAEAGLIAEADGGVIIAAMAERMEPNIAAQLAAVLDCGMVRSERDGLSQARPASIGIVACDEGENEEAPPHALTDRCGLLVDLRSIMPREAEPGCLSAQAIAGARCRAAGIDEALVSSLCMVALQLGIPSLRVSIRAVRVACILAALDGRQSATEADAVLAAALVLAPRATCLPASDETEEAEAEEQPPSEPDAPTEPPPDSPDDETQGSNARPPDEILLEAALAALPPGLLADIARGARQKATRGAGRSGPAQRANQRGRAIGSRRGEPGRSARLDLVASLRAAAPWQGVRRAEAAAAIAGDGHPTRLICVRREDLRVKRLKSHQRSTTIFVVDASGSAALQRLAEAKGAVKLMLADCYVRRDEVAMIAFRSKSAELVLAPTRALARAQRALTAMAGGGGTPIATAIDRTIALIDQVRRAGRAPMVVFLSDGRANVSREGEGGREKAHADALAAARALAETRVSALFIDTAAQPQERAREIAGAMGAGYLALPNADAKRLAAALGAGQRGGQRAAA